MKKNVAREIQVALEARGKEEETLPELVEFYSRLLEIQYKAEKRLGKPDITLGVAAVKEKQAQGLPLLNFKDLAIDWAYLKDVYDSIEALFREYPQLFNLSEDVAERSGYSLSWLKKAIKVWYVDGKLPKSTRKGMDEHLLGDLLQATLKPFLSGYRKVLLPLVEQEEWRRGYCPVCGGSPDFSILDKERGSRWLICSRCDAQWVFQRLKCPYCGTEDQTKLAYFTNDDGLYRLYVCEQCKHYIKTLDLRHTESEFQISVERFFALKIDMQAQEQGYTAGTVERNGTTENPEPD